MRGMKLLAALAVVPSLLVAQQDPVEKLGEVLPDRVADEVVALVTDAISRGLPGEAIANRALEAVAKGRSGAEVSAAARAFAQDLAEARGALAGAGRAADASEIEAAATAMSMGVDGDEVSRIAEESPSGRSLAVPLAVIGALVNRGLPADEAIAAVLSRLEQLANNTELVEMPGEAGRMLAEGMRPAEVGLALASSRAGFQVPPAAGGPPPNVPTNGGRPGELPKPPVEPPVPPVPVP